MKKPRSDKKLAALPAHQQEVLRRWLVDENVSYDQAKDRLYQDFGVETSVGAISKFWAEECFGARFTQASDFADRVAEEVAQGGADKFDQATISLIKQKAFERAVAKDGDIKELAILAGIIGESARLQLKRDELQLSLAKFREATKTAIERGLDALYSELKAQPEALELFERLKAVVMTSVDGGDAA